MKKYNYNDFVGYNINRNNNIIYDDLLLEEVKEIIYNYYKKDFILLVIKNKLLKISILAKNYYSNFIFLSKNE